MIRILFSAILSFFCLSSFAQDTFSIVAVDENTGEVGSAGASCVDDTNFPGSGGVRIISDLIPGLGAINTQSYYDDVNQLNARTRLILGDTPQQVIDWLENNDVSNDPTVRQYGVAYLDPNNSTGSAAFTGSNCLDYKNHIIGPNYAIQGNVLLGPQILDSIKARFLNTAGDLAHRLMAALQGANVPGADSRCLGEGVSSLSSFVRVAKPDDIEGGFYLDIYVGNTPFGEEPIDSLQILFDDWEAALTSVDDAAVASLQVNVFPNPVGQGSVLEIKNGTNDLEVVVFNALGQTIDQFQYPGKAVEIGQKNYPAGVLLFTIKQNQKTLQSGSFVVKP